MPLTRIQQAGLAANSVIAAAIVDGTIIVQDLADNSVSAAKLANGAVDLAGAKVTGNNNVTISGGNVFGVGLRVEAAVASANVLTLNYSNATVFTHTATTNLAIIPTNLPQQQGVMLLKLTNGGSRTISYTGNAGFVANTAPTLTAAGTDFLVLQGNATHYSVFVQLDVR